MQGSLQSRVACQGVNRGLDWGITQSKQRAQGLTSEKSKRVRVQSAGCGARINAGLQKPSRYLPECFLMVRFSQLDWTYDIARSFLERKCECHGSGCISRSPGQSLLGNAARFCALHRIFSRTLWYSSGTGSGSGF